MKLIVLILAVLLPLDVDASTISVGPNDIHHGSLQKAIDAANAGDRIEVMSGIFYENVIVAKRVALIGRGSPVIDAGKKGSAITIIADGVIIEGFTLRNSSASINYPQEDGGIR